MVRAEEATGQCYLGFKQPGLLFEVIEWAKTNGLANWGWISGSGFNRDPESCMASVAAQLGRIEALKWMAENGHPAVREIPMLLCETAARNGQLQVVQWLREKKHCPWSRAMSSAAARGGHREVLIWAVNHGCPWGSNTCVAAVVGGHLPVLK